MILVEQIGPTKRKMFLIHTVTFWLEPSSKDRQWQTFTNVSSRASWLICTKSLRYLKKMWRESSGEPRGSYTDRTLNSSIGIYWEKPHQKGEFRIRFWRLKLIHSRKIRTSKAPVTLIMFCRGIIFQNFAFKWSFREFKSLRNSLTQWGASHYYRDFVIFLKFVFVCLFSLFLYNKI